MHGGYRRPGTDLAFFQRTGLAYSFVALLFLIGNIPAIAAMRFPDPDDVLRLVQVRDLLAGQGWFDLHQYRIDAPHGGVLMHWSRLVDIPLALSIFALTPIFGQAGAEVATLVLVPMLTLGVAVFLVARIAWRMFDEEVTGFACLAIAISIPVISQLKPLRIDHHGWQIVLALVAANGLMSRNPRVGGWTMGLALAVWLSISIEGLPLAAAFMGLLALRWLRDSSERSWLLNAMGALTLSSVALFLLTRGFVDLQTHCDAISPVHIALFGWGALGVGVMAAQRPHPLAYQVLGFGAIAAGAGAIVYFAAPQCAGGGFGGLDPIVKQYWYQNVAEGLPMWRQPIDSILVFVTIPIIGIYASLRLAGQSSSWLRQFWFEYALLLIAALAVSVLVLRAGAVAAALAAPPVGWQIVVWCRSLRKIDQPAKRVLAFAAMALVLAPALPFTLVAMATPAKATSGVSVGSPPTCSIAEAGPILRRLGRAEMLAPLDLGPAIIYESDLSVFATSHHRGNEAMRDTIQLFLGTTEEARLALGARGTQYVAMCPGLPEPKVYARNAPNGLAADLLNDRIPNWLTPVEVSGDGTFRVWKVAR